MNGKLPSREQCIGLLRKYGLKENMVEHSKAVERVAVFLAERFKEKGLDVDVRLVSRASLLHDIDKFLTLDGKARHGSLAPGLLESEQLHELIGIVKEHVLEQVLKGRFSSLESKIVYYADKRVNHEKICSLDERFAYLRERYGQASEEVLRRINECEPLVKMLEEEIFSETGAGRALKELI